MKHNTLPNQITLLRVLLVPVLWYLAINQEITLFAIILAIVALTDILDGFVARHFNQETTFGAKFDSFADTLVAISSIFWLWYLKQDFLMTYRYYIFSLLGLYAISQLYGLIKYKKLNSYHLYSNKIAAFCLAAFFIHILLSTPNMPFFYLTFTIAALSNIEEIMLTFFNDHIDIHRRTLFKNKSL